MKTKTKRTQKAVQKAVQKVAQGLAMAAPAPVQAIDPLAEFAANYCRLRQEISALKDKQAIIYDHLMTVLPDNRKVSVQRRLILEGGEIVEQHFTLNKHWLKAVPIQYVKTAHWEIDIRQQ